MATKFEANSYAILMTLNAPGILSDNVRAKILAYLDTAPADVKALGQAYYVEYTRKW
jgi:hypothetical protein